jgi:MFS transporter, DHA1 family, tetracycline resistance protein
MSFFLRALPLFVVLFLDSAGLGLVFPLLNSIIIDPAASFLPDGTSDQMRYFLYGLTIGIFMICWFFGAAILGDLSDHIGRKKSLMICLIGAFLGYVLAGIGIEMHSLTILILGRVIAGFTSGSQSIAQAAIVDMSTPEKKSQHIGYMMLAISIGFIVGPMMGGFLSDKRFFSGFTFATPFYVTAVLAFLNIFLLQYLFKETFKKHSKIHIRWHHAVGIFISAFRSKTVRLLTIMFLSFILGWSSYYTYISYFLLKRYGFSPLETTTFMAIIGVGFSIGFAFFPGYCSKRYTLKSSIIFSLIIAVICTAVTLLTTSSLYAVIFALPMGAFIALAYSNTITLFSDQVDSESQGWVMGITGSIMALSFGIIGLLSGLLIRESENIPLLICFILLAVSAALLFFYKRKGKAHAPEDYSK